KYLRSVAEFDNYRKRTLKEKAELILNGGEKTVVAILPVIDDMERAIANGSKTDDPEVLREGIQLIYNKFLKVLEGLGVKPIDTVNADFDTDVHEAIAMVPGMGDDKKGKVLDCVLRGYKLNDKVIRHAKVAVGQ
ncbi:MAG: nucleotide exchange factor GrpE, partial [Prevotella sp.]|nr:nucleotide exchange factor GrpE [Prevotella sp.]